MITGLRIKDFQSIGELDVDCGRITVFHGESDTGKSAIVRALYALAFNSYPSGHVRDGANHSEVEVRYEGVSIRARKGSGVNQYELDKPDTKMLGWDKVGTDVPPEVISQLEWRTLELDDGSRFTPNFSRQFDPPFLLTDSPSKRAKVLGSLTNVATLFAAIKMAGTWERRGSDRIKAQQEIVDRTDEQITPRESQMLNARAEYEEFQELVSRAAQMNLHATLLAAIVVKALAVAEGVATNRKIIELMDEAEPELDRIEELIPRVQGLNAMFNNVMLYQSKKNDAEVSVGGLDLMLEGADRALSDFIDENEFCPMCGRDWHKHE